MIKARKNNVIVENDSLIAIRAILEKIKIPYKICNIVEDIRILSTTIIKLNLYIVIELQIL